MASVYVFLPSPGASIAINDLRTSHGPDGIAGAINQLIADRVITVAPLRGGGSVKQLVINWAAQARYLVTAAELGADYVLTVNLNDDGFGPFDGDATQEVY